MPSSTMLVLEDREKLRDELLGLDGVMAAAYQDGKPHLMVMAYDPDTVKSSIFVKLAQEQGLHAELIGL